MNHVRVILYLWNILKQVCPIWWHMKVFSAEYCPSCWPFKCNDFCKLLCFLTSFRSSRWPVMNVSHSLHPWDWCLKSATCGRPLLLPCPEQESSTSTSRTWAGTREWQFVFTYDQSIVNVFNSMLCLYYLLYNVLSLFQSSDVITFSMYPHITVWVFLWTSNNPGDQLFCASSCSAEHVKATNYLV